MTTEDELEQLREEMQGLTRVVAHDLRSPVRNMQTDIGLELHRDRTRFARHCVPDELDRTRDATARMATRLEALRQYARLRAVKPKREAVDLDALVADVVRAFTHQIDELDAGVTVSRLATVQGDPERLGALLSHLLDNALRFRRPCRTEIRIDADELDHCCRVRVSDNGIGIAPEFHDRVFGVFERLHLETEYGGGAGVGLALCRRIAEQHDGSIGIESEPGVGSTFEVQLPNSPLTAR